MGQYVSNNRDEDKRSASFQNIQSSQPNSDVSYISSSNYRGEVEDKRSARFQNIQSSQPNSDVSYNASFKYRGEVEDKRSASFQDIQSSQPKSDVSYNSSKEVELLITYSDVLLKLEKELREKLRIKELLKEEERWIKHYCSSHKILLVGEGDFSFSACLAKAFGSAHNMVATSLDSKGKLCKKHWSCKPHLKELKRLGCLVLHGVDVYDMDGHPKLINVKFDRIIYNFPHAGHFPTLCERDNSLIQMHKELLSAFFFNAREMLTEDGEVHVSHRDDYPYNRWKITKLAKKAGLVLLEKVDFWKSDYPGYHNKRGGDIESNKTFPLGDCFTFKFTPRDKYTSFAHIEEDGLCESTWH